MDDGKSWGNESYDEVKKWMQSLAESVGDENEPDEDYKSVPINSARIISEAYEKSQVIIVCWDKEHCRSHVTTYGKDIIDSQLAAMGGNMIKKELGWDDKLCHSESARVKAVKAALKRFKALVEGQECKGGICHSTYTCKVHEDLTLANDAIKAML